MSKKKQAKQAAKSKKKTQHPDLAAIPREELYKNAQLFLERGQYKKAIENYKTILSQPGDHGDALDKLVQAYQGRMKELGDKGMHREAIELWEHVAKSYGREMDLPFYLEQLFQSGEYPKASQVLYRNQEKIRDTKWFQKQESTLALLALAEVPGILASVPPDSPLVQHKHLVQEALRVLAEGQEERVAEILQPIGLRSPYRDWKVLLKGLTAFYQRQDQEAQGIFNRISVEDSPIAGVIPLFNLAMQPDEGNHKKAQSISLQPEEISFLKEMLGNRAEVLSLLRSLKQASQSDSGPAMARILRKLADYLPADEDRELLRQSSMGILARSSTVKGFAKSYQALWGVEPDPFERCRLSAIMHERKNGWAQANRSWQECLDVIKNDEAASHFPTEEEKNLALAQILRRMAEHTTKMFNPDDMFFRALFGFGPEDKPGPKEPFIKYLTESLEYDPQDIQTYQQVIDYYRQRGRKKEVTEWLEKFIQVFPGQIDALIELAIDAFNRKAMQKALRFLDAALQHDPLNEKARDLKIMIHIISAHQRIWKKKFALARKDFGYAQTLLTSKTNNGRLQVTWGMAEIIMADKTRGHSLIREGIQLGRDGVGIYFHIFIEANLWGIPDSEIAPYKEVLDRKLRQEPTAEEIRQLIHLGLAYFRSGIKVQPDTRKRIGIVGPFVEKAIHKIQSTESELLEICHFLAMVRLYPLLVHYAREAEKRFSQNLRFRFYALVGRSQGKIPMLWSMDLYEQLANLEEKFREAADLKMSKEVSEFIDGIHPLYSPTHAERVAADTLPDTKRGRRGGLRSRLKQMRLF
ncbi:MAG: hypothetical protein AB1611_00495 [bacterium]